MNEEDKLIQEQFKQLPDNLRKAIETVPWKSSIKEIAVTNKIPLEQVDTVERETMFILYGFENPDDYIDNLMRETQIDEETALNIAKSVDENIFKSIATQMENAAPQETKVEAMQRLKGRMAGESARIPEIVPKNPVKLPESNHGASLPVVEKGEVVHSVPHDTKLDMNNELGIRNNEERQENKLEVPKPISTPHYPGDKDPYREPLE